MTIGAGIGIANFTFEDGNGFWEWVDLCDNGGVDSIWQSDRIIEKTPNLETMSVMAALAGGEQTPEVWHERSQHGSTRPCADGESLRNH